MQQNSTKPDRKSRRLALALCLAGLIPIGVFGGYAYLQHQAATGNYPKRELIGGQLDPDVFEGTRKAQIARAQEFRAKWQPWAQAHQTELKRMLSASPNDQAALMVVWNQCPTQSDKNAIVAKTELLSGVGAPWSWTANTKEDNTLLKTASMDSRTRQIFVEVNKYSYKMLNKNFAERHDMKVAEAIPNGPSSVCLWASGRITDEKFVLNTKAGKGQAAFAEETEEIQAPFDFLSQ